MKIATITMVGQEVITIEKYKTLDVRGPVVIIEYPSLIVKDGLDSILIPLAVIKKIECRETITPIIQPN